MSDSLLPTGPAMPTQPLSALLPADARLSGPAAGQSAEQAAKGFESILLYRMLEEMKRSIPESGLFETGVSEQVQDIFWYYLAQEMAEKGGLGLWRSLQARLAEAAELEPGTAAAEAAP